MKGRATIHQGDVLEWVAQYDGPKAHACLCDPPYHLTSITERFGKNGAAPAKDRDGVYRRASAGFMGQAWDGGGISFQPETWAALARHLHPGAFVMAFAGTRGYHRMACAMEDAGLRIMPCMIWLQGQGFPKSTRIDTQIDKAVGAEREVIASRKFTGTAKHGACTVNGLNQRPNMASREAVPITSPATDLARAWAGHRYGGQVLKPCLEMIAVAQVPYRGRPLDCITRTGAGALNVDGARIAAQAGDYDHPGNDGIADNRSIYGRFANGNQQPPSPLGRWPSNLLIDSSPEVAAMFPDAKSYGDYPPSKSQGTGNGVTYCHKKPQGPVYADEGSAARFYFTSDWQAEVFEQIAQADPGFYCAKAGRGEREIGLLGQVPCLACGELFTETHISKSGRQEECRRSNHPTVKPLRLTRYLATLLLPPAAYAPRRLLQPFSGSGSEAIGALLAGWEEVCGIEQSAEYAEIARARAAWWAGNCGLFEELTAEEEAQDVQEAMEL